MLRLLRLIPSALRTYSLSLSIIDGILMFLAFTLGLFLGLKRASHKPGVHFRWLK